MENIIIKEFIQWCERLEMNELFSRPKIGCQTLRSTDEASEYEEKNIQFLIAEEILQNNEMQTV